MTVRPNQILIATSNRGKAQEISAILTQANHSTLTLDQVFDALPAPPDEPHDTYQANALHKARYYHQLSGLPTIAEDSGLEVQALDNQPGIHSARFAPTSAEAITKLLHLLKQVPGSERTARFICCAVYVNPNHDPSELISQGITQGEITQSPSGNYGFGYDPIFYLPDYQATFAELKPEQKNAVSHRVKALKGLISQLSFKA